MRKLLITLTFGILPLLSFAFEHIENGVIYNYYKRDSEGHVENLASVEGAESAVTDVVTLPTLSILDKDGNKEYYIVRVFDGYASAWANCSNLKTLSINLSGREDYLNIRFGPNFPTRNLETISVNTGSDFYIVENKMLIYNNFGWKSLVLAPGALTECEIPNTVISIASYAFKDSHVKSLQLPASVTQIYGCAFQGSDLEEITIPASVTSTAGSCFSGCANLKKVIYFGTSQSVDWVKEVPVSATVYVIPSMVDKIKEVWSGTVKPTYSEPTIENLTCRNGKIHFEIPAQEMTEIKNVLVQALDKRSMHDSRNTLLCDTLIDNGVYDLEASPLSTDFRISVSYCSTLEQSSTRYYSKEFAQQAISMIDRVAIDKNSAVFTLNPDFSDYDKKVKEYGILLTEEDCRIANALRRSANEENSVRFDSLEINENYSYVPYIVVAGKNGDILHRGNTAYMQSRFLPNPRVEALELTPTRAVLAIKTDYAVPCDSMSFGIQTSLGSFEMPDSCGFTLDAIPLSTSSVALNRFTAAWHYTNIRCEAKTYRVDSSVRNISFQLPELQWTTEPASALSNDRAIIAAQTNLCNMWESTGFEWRRYDAPELVPSNKVYCPVINGSMSGLLSNLSQSTYYKYRPFYEEADGTMHYGEWIAFGTADAYVYFEPTVNTDAPSRIEETSASVSGYALGGSDDVIEQGFEYWAVAAQSRAAANVHVVLAQGQRMTATLTDLEPGTTYTVRAFAKTAKETVYGTEQQFTTAGSPVGAIEEIAEEGAVKAFNVYSLTGVCVKRNATDLSGLRPGIYIANGKKIRI